MERWRTYQWAQDIDPETGKPVGKRRVWDDSDVLCCSNTYCPRNTSSSPALVYMNELPVEVTEKEATP